MGTEEDCQAVEPLQEQRLVERARAGDRAALEALLLRYQNTVYRFGARMCGHPSDAEEVVQETLLTAAKAIGQYRGEGAFSTWLYRIARSLCRKKRRRSKFAPAADEQLDVSSARAVPDPSSAPEELLARREIAAALKHAVTALPGPFREVFLLRDLEGLSTEETAKVLGLRPATVKTRLHRARLAIRNALAPLLLTESPASSPSPGCPDAALLLSRYLEGDLSPRVCARMEKHLETCAQCRGACDVLRQVLSLCRSHPGPEVPSELRERLRQALREALAAAHR
ncbi:MAG: sigma-70 family RNA polymerase sigma factor [Candidatus Binatia bacterium]|nr:sigma-70 family RNA polymerase sigma factor [Candidatus Binatia bacterium]